MAQYLSLKTSAITLLQNLVEGGRLYKRGEEDFYLKIPSEIDFGWVRLPVNLDALKELSDLGSFAEDGVWTIDKIDNAEIEVLYCRLTKKGHDLYQLLFEDY